MKIVNLTPHTITLVTESGNIVVDPSGTLARVRATTVRIGEVDVNGIKVPLTSTRYSNVEGLPAPEEGTLYIVSSLVAGRVTERDDVVIPNESVRDDKGRIIGCKSLGHV